MSGPDRPAFIRGAIMLGWIRFAPAARIAQSSGGASGRNSEFSGIGGCPGPVGKTLGVSDAGPEIENTDNFCSSYMFCRQLNSRRF